MAKLRDKVQHRHMAMFIAKCYEVRKPCISYSVRTVAQTHRAQIVRPDLLNVLNSLDQMWHKLGWVLRCREVAQVWHRLMHCTWDLICRFLRHLGCVGPIVFASQHVYGAVLCIDRCDAGATVPAAEVKIEIAVENLRYVSIRATVNF